MRSLLPLLSSLVLAIGANEGKAVNSDTLVKLQTIDGQVLSGSIAGWTEAGVTFTPVEATSPREVSSKELLSIQWVKDAPVSTKEQAFVELVDGSRLPIKGYTTANRVAEISSSLSREVLTLSTQRIRRVQFDATREFVRGADEEVTRNKLDGDVIGIRKKKAKEIEFISGILGDVSAESVEFEWDGEQIPVRRSKVAVLGYYRAKMSKIPQPICFLETHNGARLAVSSFRFDGDDVTLSTPSGLELTVSQSDLKSADCSLGKLSFLSDLRADRQKWTPLLGLSGTSGVLREFGMPRINRSFTGSVIELTWPKTEEEPARTVSYEKGLAVRSGTELRYRVPEGMQRFVGLVGIDPDCALEGNAILQIYTDKRLAWEGIVQGGVPPRSIDIGVAGARRLRITVDYGENLDFGDRLHLVEARFTK